MFIDSGGDLMLTRERFLSVMKPYLYVYGNHDVSSQHPKTLAIDLWAKQPMANINLKD
jgi:hypothetical protein